MSDASGAVKQTAHDAGVQEETDDSVIVDRQPRAPQMLRLGRYRLVREIASGGMASVNLAVADGLDKLVALKMIHPHLAQEDAFVEMFLDEARISSSISHRNVCNVFDFGEADGRYFIAMDYLSGQTLRDVIQRLRKRPDLMDAHKRAAFVAYILAEACEGLHAAHEVRGPDGKLLNVVHRDVSPHNLFVTYDGNVSVVDFGIARASDRIQHTATGVLKGKFSYMAPEQVRQLEIDRRADVWSLGVCLWETLTLQRLFVRSSQADTLMSVMMDRVRPPSEVIEGLPAALDNIVLRALARTPQQRYATARELGRDLMQFVRSSSSAMGMVEVEQLMETLFPKEIEASRRLMQGARLASIEDTQWGLDAATPANGRSPTRSSVLRARVPSVSGAVAVQARREGEGAFEGKGAADGTHSAAHQPMRTDTIFGATAVQRLRGIKMLAVALSLAGGVAVALTWGVGRRAEPVAPTAVAITPSQQQLPAASAPAVAALPQAAAVAPTSPAVDELPAPVEAAPAEGPAAPEDAKAALRRKPRTDGAALAMARRDLPSAVRSASRLETAEPTPLVAAVPTPVEEPEEKAAPEAPTLPVAAHANTAESSSAASTALRTAPVPTASAPAPRAPSPAPTPQNKGPLAAKVSFGKMQVEGSLGSGVVARMLSRAEPLLQKCYATAATKAGRNEYVSLAASLTIDEMGAVRLLQQGSHPLPGLATCVADSLKRLRSERKPDVGTVRVELEVSFRAP